MKFDFSPKKRNPKITAVDLSKEVLDQFNSQRFSSITVSIQLKGKKNVSKEIKILSSLERNQTLWRRNDLKFSLKKIIII